MVRINNILQYPFNHMHLCSITKVHCVGIWRNEIYDASHTNVLQLTKKNIDWCCGDEGPYRSSAIDALRIIPSKRRAKQIQKHIKFGL